MSNATANSFEEPTSAAPVEGLMRRPEVLSLVRCHKVTLWRMIRRGTFPKPVHITTKAVAWRRSEVLAWLKNLQ